MKKVIVGFTFLSPFLIYSQNQFQEQAPQHYYQEVGDTLSLQVDDRGVFEVESVEGFILNLTQNKNCPDSFHVVNLSKLEEKLTLWENYLPSVNPFYSIKTNHDPKIVAKLADLGISFDCASQGEIKQILDLGVEPNRVLFSHPRKQLNCIEYASQMGIETFVFDSLEELKKMEAICPNGKFILRITTDDQYSSSRLSQKFGASLLDAKKLIDEALAKDIDLIGIAFHVGSNCFEWKSYQKALEDSVELFEYAKEKWDVSFSLLDIGGGWPGPQDDIFISVAQQVETFLAHNFDSNVQFIAEPGRFFAAPVVSSVISVIGKSSDETLGERKISYYLSDGIFGLFISSLYYNYDKKLIDKEGWDFQPVKREFNNSVYPSKFWGATCDSSDKIYDEILFPEIETGDYIFSHNMGAYTTSLQTSFNQIPPSVPFYVVEKKR